MRTGFILCAFLVALTASHNVDDVEELPNRVVNARVNGIEDLIKTIIKVMKRKIQDPVTIKREKFHINSTLVVSSGYISNFKLAGLRGMQLSHIKVKGKTIDMTLKFPLLKLDTGYFLHSSILELFPFCGAGKACIHVKDLQIDIKGMIQVLKRQQLKMSNTNATITLCKSEFNISGLCDRNDAKVNAILSKKVPKLLNEYKKFISLLISPSVQEAFNDIFNPHHSGPYDKDISTKSYNKLFPANEAHDEEVFNPRYAEPFTTNKAYDEEVFNPRYPGPFPANKAYDEEVSNPRYPGPFPANKAYDEEVSNPRYPGPFPANKAYDEEVSNPRYPGPFPANKAYDEEVSNPRYPGPFPANKAYD